jgi:citrate lyase subunit beta/citryl-CoA lyase
MLRKAAATAADEVICDLEDACANQQKAGARSVVAQALRELDWKGKIRAVRVNPADSIWYFDDVCQLVADAGRFVDVVVIPKVRGVGDIKFTDYLLTLLEKKHGLDAGRIRLEVLVETAEAIEAAGEIARASKRTDSLIFGVADYAASIGAPFDARDMWSEFQYPRQRIVNAARAAGLLAVDAVSFIIKDIELLKSDAARARRLGFDGKWVVHPGQIEPVNAAFTPTEAEVAHARKIIDAWKKAGAESGRGALTVDGEMVDLATARVCARILDRAGVEGVEL